MWTITEVKSRGKEAFKANYWYCVLAVFVLGAVGSLSGILAALALLGKIFLYNPFSVGCCAFYKMNAKTGSADFGIVGEGFKNYWHNVGVMLLNDIYIFLWSMLLVIPGVVKMYSYRMVPYILLDHPELTANEVITRSREMMDGNKGNAFLLDLSFFGWYVLGMIPFGLGLIFWTMPYHSSTNAALYLRLNREPGVERRPLTGGQTGVKTEYSGTYTPPAPQLPYRQGYAVRALAGPLRGQVFPLDSGGLSIGRLEDNTICFPSGTTGISRRHCQMTVRDSTVFLADLNSTYGTFVEPGTRIQSNRWYPISVGTKFYLGSPDMLFELIAC